MFARARARMCTCVYIAHCSALTEFAERPSQCLSLKVNNSGHNKIFLLRLLACFQHGNNEIINYHSHIPALSLSLSLSLSSDYSGYILL